MKFTLHSLNCCLNSLKESFASYVSGRRAGNATLVTGTVTVADPKITASSYILHSRKTLGGTVGNTSYLLTAGTGFTLNSSSATDTSVISYEVIY